MEPSSARAGNRGRMQQTRSGVGTATMQVAKLHSDHGGSLCIYTATMGRRAYVIARPWRACGDPRWGYNAATDRIRQAIDGLIQIYIGYNTSKRSTRVLRYK